MAVAKKPCVLLITRNFPPLVGGMERLLHHVFLELSQEFDVALCGPTGASRFVPGAQHAVVEISPRPVWRYLLGTFGKGLAMARDLRPDVVFSGSGLTALPARLIAEATGARCITYVHGLDIVARHPLYRALFLPAIRRCDLVLANSESTRRLACAVEIPIERIRVLHPGVELPPAVGAGAIARFRRKIGASNRPLLLSVGRLTRRKGLREFIERSMPAIVAAVPDTLLVIVGGEALNAVGQPMESMRTKIQATATSLGLGNHLRMLGEVSDEELRLAYRAASALVFPVIDLPGDIEGFGMVAVEAAAHGLPTVAFGIGGIPEAVADGVSGRVIRPGDYVSLAKTCTAILNGDQEFSESGQFGRRFSWATFGSSLRSHVGALVQASAK